MRSDPRSPFPRHSLLALWLGYVSFVIYGSLVPLDFRPLPLEKAWALFQQTRMFNLGIQSRADWIANGVLYVPVGFLTAWLFAASSKGIHSEALVAPRPDRLPLAGVFCIVLALGVEFTQLFFPPRTVSLNDLLAEIIGSGIGLLAASLSPEWIGKFLHAHRFDPGKIFWHLVEVFLVAYVAFSLFPYDVLVSLDEMAQKARGGSWGWWLAGEAPLDLQAYFKLCAEVLLTLPFGFYLGYRLAGNPDESKPSDGIQYAGPAKEVCGVQLDSGFRRNDVTPRSLLLAAILGALLGGALEIAQFFTATGVSQGVSVITRMTGSFAGLLLWQQRHALSPDRLALMLRRYALPLAGLYLALLLAANGWFSYRWRGSEFAASQLAELKFLPFYYHYYTTEARALFSLASVVLMYLPVGVMTWAHRGTPTRALWPAVILAAIVESGKLFLQGIHPDPTNILLAGVAASLGVLGIQLLIDATHRARQAKAEFPIVGEVGYAGSSPLPESDATSGSARTLLTMLAILGFCAYRAATFPAFPIVIVLVLAICAVTVWRHPAAAFLFIPMTLPVFDFAPWSGRFYFDEFDLLVMTCLAVGYARTPAPASTASRNPALTVCLTLVAASLLISTAIALWPWQAPGENDFTNYLSPYNALRIGKGALWAFLCIGLMRRQQSNGLNVIRPWALGMTTGLALTVAVIVWERITFTSLFDFASDYRVTGPFSAMHIGGAYIECFLVVATPFLLLLMLQTHSSTNRAIGVCLLLATTYALMVTYSRGGYAAFAVSIVQFLLVAFARSEQTRQRWSLAVLLPTLAIGASVPILTGEFAQQRLARIVTDLDVRTAHWRSVLDLRTPNLTTALFGMGLGSLPKTLYLLGNHRTRTGSYQLRTENDNTFLRLTSGEALYLEQIVSIEPRRSYLLKLDVRSSMPGTINLSLCEKWLLTSFECRWINVAIPLTGENWVTVEVPADTLRFEPSPWYTRKPIKLSLHTPSGIYRQVDVDNIRLEASDVRNLLWNGDFEASLDGWFFTSDDHLQWHAKSLPIAVLFDQGWLGLISVFAFFALALKHALRSAWVGNLNAAATLSALVAFLVVGAFDTLIDTPRFMAFLLICGAMNSVVARLGTPTNMESPS